VVAAVTISRSAFPNRLEHAIVLDRFKALWRKGDHVFLLNRLESFDEDEDSEQELRLRNAVETLLTWALKPLEVEMLGSVVRAFVLGKTRAYFRAGALEYLENERVKALSVWAVEMQKIVRSFLMRVRYKKMRLVATRMQTQMRMRTSRARYQSMRASAVRIENWSRCKRAARTLIVLRRNHMATLIQTHWRMGVAAKDLKTKREAAIVVQTMVRGGLQRPKFRLALHEKREEAKLENQVRALQRKLEEAEAKRIEVEKLAEEKARRAVEAYQRGEEKKDTPESSVASENETRSAAASRGAASGASFHTPASPSVAERQLSQQQQQTLMDESGKMLEYLRKEVFKLRSQNTQLRTDCDLLKDNNQRLMDANASAGASFQALNQHTKQVTKASDKIKAELAATKQLVQKLNVTQVELKEELKMKQATYIAEVHSRLQYQKGLGQIVDVVQTRCRDTRLVEDVLSIADACEAEYMNGPTGMTPARPFPSPTKGSGTDSGSGLMSSIRSLFS
jgi:myosin heavy subunit